MKIRLKIDYILEQVLTFLMGFMVLNVLWQVASRYILNNPSTFTDELSRYVLIWVGLLGAAYASGKNLHVSIDLLQRKLSDRNKKIQRILIESCILLFSIFVLLIGGSRLVYITFELGQTSSAIHLPLGFVYIVLPLSGLLICYYTISNLYNLSGK